MHIEWLLKDAQQRHQEYSYCLFPSAMGLTMALWRPEGLYALLPVADEAEGLAQAQQRFSTKLRAQDLPSGWQAAFAALLDGQSLEWPCAVKAQGTAFQLSVWQALLSIPRGEVRSYSQLAEQLNAPQSVRALGTACGANPLAVLLPCHRVVAKNGALTGYRWGLAHKQRLLEQERVAYAG